jgi:leader peptidase (prepilin peptidase)/N-methyltransferase
MTPVFATVSAGITTFVFWAIAAGAARRRRVTLGTLPCLLPVLGGLWGCIAALDGAPLPALVAAAGLTVAAVVDARTGSIFDPLTASMLLAALALSSGAGTCPTALAGAAVVGGLLFALYAVSKRRGIGLGDVKLGTAMGAALGASTGACAIALAFVLGGAYAAWLLVTRRAAGNTKIRFAPFIATGAFAAQFVAGAHRP